MAHRGTPPGTRWLHGGGRGGRIARRGSWQFAMRPTNNGWQTFSSPPDSEDWNQGPVMSTLQQLLSYLTGMTGPGGPGGPAAGPPGGYGEYAPTIASPSPDQLGWIDRGPLTGAGSAGAQGAPSPATAAPATRTFPHYLYPVSKPGYPVAPPGVPDAAYTYPGASVPPGATPFPSWNPSDASASELPEVDEYDDDFQ